MTLNLAGHHLSVHGSHFPGLGVPGGASLIISDSVGGGTLSVIGGSRAAGIGGGERGAGGSVTITGGTVTAQGGSNGAGIGGGEGGSQGTVTITGVTVTARGRGGGAGIGGGAYSGTSADTVTITGGTVTAQGAGGAGIGGGLDGSGAMVSIWPGAVVTASGSNSGIAIGSVTVGASRSFGSLSNAGTLTVPVGNDIKIPGWTTVTNTGAIQNAGILRGTDDDGEGTIENNGTIVNTGTIDASLRVTVHNTTVALDKNGGIAPANRPAVYAATFQDGQVAFPANATWTGHTFLGWFTAATGGAPVGTTTDLGTNGPKTTMLYARGQGWGRDRACG